MVAGRRINVGCGLYLERGLVDRIGCRCVESRRTGIPVSRSPIPCPKCGETLADRRRRGTARWRRGVWRMDHAEKPDTLVIRCPACLAVSEWEQKREVIYDVRAA